MSGTVLIIMAIIFFILICVYAVRINIVQNRQKRLAFQRFLLSQGFKQLPENDIPIQDKVLNLYKKGKSIGAVDNNPASNFSFRDIWQLQTGNFVIYLCKIYNKFEDNIPEYFIIIQSAQLNFPFFHLVPKFTPESKAGNFMNKLFDKLIIPKLEEIELDNPAFNQHFWLFGESTRDLIEFFRPNLISELINNNFHVQILAEQNIVILMPILYNYAKATDYTRTINDVVENELKPMLQILKYAVSNTQK
jgi:hypothetical protein